jgi:DHA2 family multidrug resistance protein
MDSWAVIWTGFVQGLGLGLIFPPLSTMAFATLPPQLRTEAAGVFNLARNAGSSVGVSIVSSVFAMQSKVSHADLVQHVTPFNQMLRSAHLPAWMNLHTAHGMAALNAEITRQAAMVAYIDDFKMMMIITLAAIPLLALMRNPRMIAGAAPAKAEPVALD